MIEIHLNGQCHQVPEGTTLAALLERFNLPPTRIAVELNQNIIPKKAYPTTTLAPNDRLEIVTFVGGG